MSGRDDKPLSGQVFFEMIPLGGQMRVAAIDEATGTEVVVVAPLSASRQQMQALALAKLRRKLGGDAPEVAAPPPPRPPGRYA